MDIDKLWSRKIRVHGHGKTVESSWPLCGHVLWTFLDVAGKLPGCCAEATPDAARTATSIAKSSANHLANIGANLGADMYRRLVRCFPPTARTHLGSCPDDSPDVARTLRGHCAVVARLAALFFNKGMVSNQNTGFPIPESRRRFRSTEHLKLMLP